MEVGAVSLFDVAGVDRVAAAPSGAALVVSHVRDHVVVNRLRLLIGGPSGFAGLRADLEDLAVDRHQVVGTQIACSNVPSRGSGRFLCGFDQVGASSTRRTLKRIVTGIAAGSGPVTREMCDAIAAGWAARSPRHAPGCRSRAQLTRLKTVVPAAMESRLRPDALSDRFRSGRYDR